MFESLGQLLGEMDAALVGFAHPATERELKWDITRSLWARNFLDYVKDGENRRIAEAALNLFDAEVLPRLSKLRRGIIYGDANDHNVLVSEPWPQPCIARSVIDFGDMHKSILVAEPAIAAAYALLGEEKPLEAAAAIVGAYHRAFPLHDEEINVLFPLITARLAVSVINSAHRQSLLPDDAYVTVTEAPAWEALKCLARVHPRFALYTFRVSCGLPAVPQAAKVWRWLTENVAGSANVIPQGLQGDAVRVLDLSVGSALLPADPAELSEPTLTEKRTLNYALPKRVLASGSTTKPVGCTPPTCLLVIQGQRQNGAPFIWASTYLSNQEPLFSLRLLPLFMR